MNRSENLAKLDESFDVLVIGGGATGLGVAVDSASRGYKTLLVEARDYSQGTSSRSTKLVHGGVRYLRQGDVSLVREALHERGLLIRNAPHLVHELRLLIPTYSRWDKFFYGTGLKVYDLLSGKLNLTPTRIIGAGTAEMLAPTVNTERLNGGVLYSDAQFNDARLAVSLARTADQQGGTLLNYAPVTSLLKTGGKVTGATITDLESGAECAVRARSVVNATGVFTDTIRRMDDRDAEPILAVSQGSHLVLDRSFLPGEVAIMVPKTEDGRVIFIIPWQGHVLVGTTDTPVEKPSVEPVPTEEDVEYMLKYAGLYLSRKPGRSDVLSTFAGLRPLVKGGAKTTSKLSRDHTLLVSRSGLITITGGKWTTYRRMAEDTVNRVAQVASLPKWPSITKELRLYGADSTTPGWRELGATEGEAAQLEERYPGELHPRLPYSLAQVAYVIRNEMPVKLEDVLSRRLRALLLDAQATTEAAPKVAGLMADLQGHDDTWIQRELAGFQELAAKYTLAAGAAAGSI